MSIIDVTVGPGSAEQYEYLDASRPQQLMPLHSYRSGYQALRMRTFSPHPYLPHVSSSLPGKLPYPLCHQNGAFSAWVHVLFPLLVDLV